MIEKSIDNKSLSWSLSSKFRDYSQFLKLRLSSLVVFSAVIGALIAMSGTAVEWIALARLSLGGFLVVGASNGINQIIERRSDKLMTRTFDRPVASGRMSVAEASILALLLGGMGVWILSGFNYLTGALSLMSLVLYAFAYTPLKKISPIAVTIGAIPGALPVLIGYAAISGTMSYEILVVFALQFVWQYPHFWSIAWRLHDDYSKAGIKLLPAGQEPDERSAKYILIYTLLLVPMSIILPVFGAFHWLGWVALIASSFYLVYYAWLLFKSKDEDAAKKLMFASFIYLPIILITSLIAL